MENIDTGNWKRGGRKKRKNIKEKCKRKKQDRGRNEEREK